MKSLQEFLDASPTAAHAVLSLENSLIESGYQRLDERDSWKLAAGSGYYIIRDGRSLMAFIPGEKPPWESGINLAASHLDSPAWKVKRQGISRDKGAWRIPVEPYGGPIHRTWLDRELEAAGTVSYLDESGRLVSSVWKSGKPVAIIPSLAIHLDREVNKGIELNPQTQMAAMMPISSIANSDDTSPLAKNPLTEMMATDLNIPPSRILSADIFLVGAEKASLIGNGPDQFIVSGRLDNLAMAHAMLSGLPSPGASGRPSTILASWFDAEEIGNKTSSGAASVFLDEIIERLVLSFGGGREELLRTRRSSFLVSADMAHARHPNFPDKHDPAYAPIMGGGPVVKSHGLQHYATDSVSEAKLLLIAKKKDVELQKFISRSDIPCGFSLGPSASAATGIQTVDIGNPVWGMHSIRETASVSDHLSMINLFRGLWT